MKSDKLSVMNTKESVDFSKARKHAILLIDDEPRILRLMEQMLCQAYEVHTADDAVAGETLLLRYPEIKLVICDQYMPGEDGLSFLKRIRRRWPMMQTVLLTGKSDEKLLLEAINNGHLMRYLVKPQDISSVPKVVAEAIHQYLKQEKVAEAVQEYTRLCLLKDSLWGWWRLGPSTLRFWLRLAAGIVAALLFLTVLFVLSSGVIRLL